LLPPLTNKTTLLYATKVGLANVKVALVLVNHRRRISFGYLDAVHCVVRQTVDDPDCMHWVLVTDVQE
jgi:hypothetical protein